MIQPARPADRLYHVLNMDSALGCKDGAKLILRVGEWLTSWRLQIPSIYWRITKIMGSLDDLDFGVEFERDVVASTAIEEGGVEFPSGSRTEMASTHRVLEHDTAAQMILRRKQ